MRLKLNIVGPWKLSSTTVALLLLFQPLPLGLRTSDLSIMALLGVLILFINRKIRTSRSGLLIVLLATTTLGTLYSAFEGETFSLFQFFRGMIFPMLMLWLIQANISIQLFKELDRILPIIIFGAVTSALLYFIFGSDIYNSTLDIPYEDAVYKRLFVYPTYFFLILFVDAVARSSPTQWVYALLLAASGSKAIYLSLVIVYLFFFVQDFLFQKLKYVFCGFGLIGIVAFFGGLFNRIEDFSTDGDPWRYYEALAAIYRLSDLVRFFIGNGAGITYWEGRGSIVEDFENEMRVVVNSSFDVHNGFLTLALRFGVPLSIFFLYVIFKAIPKISARWALGIVIFLNIYLSHGPVQVVEAVGLALGIRYLSYKCLMHSTLKIPRAAYLRTSE